ncbi:MAG TPA: hypothetical protein VJV22_11660 [Acidobacteriaceae bacterium]|nr:hypothetical protein [Acidobacteriaceae bacterium]
MTCARRIWIVFTATLLTSLACSAQGLQSGNLFGVHVVTVTLKPGATMNQFTDFYVHQVIPEYEKNWPGLRGYLLKSFQRDAHNQFAIVWLFNTVADRNRNFDANDRPNELEKAALQKVKPIEDKLKDLYGSYTIKYTHDDDWVVQ